MDNLFYDALSSVLVFTGFGVIMGTALAFLAIKFKVEVDPMLAAAKEALPGANCGACGFAGCESYADALVENPDVPTNKCTPGGPAVAQKLAEITGKAMGEMGDMVSILCCANPGAVGAQKYAYEGVSSCAAANTAFGGPNPCIYGCIGLGDCAAVCPFDAIVMVDQKPVIVYEKCTGCNKCVVTCPKHVLVLASRSASAVIECNNPEKGASVRSVCGKGCISCQMCVRKGPEGVFLVTDLGIKVDFDKSIGKADEDISAIACPTKVLHPFNAIKQTNNDTLANLPH